MNTTPSSSRHSQTGAASNHPTPDQDQPQADATPREPTTGERALVLGGGGSTGNAWLIGVIAGLFDAGVDITTADLTIGTSAGSTAAAQLAGATPAELFAAVVAAVPQQRTTPEANRASTATRPVTDHLERMREIIAAASDVADMRRRMGAIALELDAASGGSWQERWRTTVAARLPGWHWPQRRLLITAVDAHSGEPVVFDRDSGVDLVDAVAASCAGGGFPYSIGSRRYIDGGYRSNSDNADLAAGYRRVLVLSPLSGRSLHPLAWGTRLATQVDELRASGSRVITVFPDGDSEHLFGANAMNPELRPLAAQAGYGQGAALVEQIRQFWG